jgi:hypothetical protein
MTDYPLLKPGKVLEIPESFLQAPLLVSTVAALGKRTADLCGLLRARFIVGAVFNQGRWIGTASQNFAGKKTVLGTVAGHSF